MFNFKKKFGQNFISDTNLLKAIVADAGINEDDVVLEIGAGAGALTKELSLASKRVVSYEIDFELKEQLLSLGLKNVEFRFEDFMKANLKDLDAELRKFEVVANLPYYITTPIIFKLLEESEKVSSLSIMVQKEVAERIIAKAGGKDYGILTVMINFYGNATISRIVKRQMFNPMPNVDSAMVSIKIDRNKFVDIDRAKFGKFVKACFSMRRKTLLNNLSTIIPKEKLKSVLDEEILKRRAETFSTDEFVELFKKLNVCQNQ